ncbi:membrane protease YdiL (CAAX protease family) [Clostridium punense]|uniref:Membrane protease YdiL (CAAX protease family) n=1 Tax=Clostridium punense TaxID=1054297 RepID=A0ABS4K9G6_9CLOT|nr:MULTISPECIES: CPBP family intramembrane glutamic endopeptidase [Clostridium]EQB87988.1 hypothetical protein M918_06240 [Clostridium sp. BL8]MBP2023269.1 membrane protease YdiL (CAAX protease family) [Clostridium punense]
MRYLNKKNLSTLMWDLGFLTVGFLCLYFYSRYNINSYYKSPLTYPLLMTGAIAVTIGIVYLFPIRGDERRTIYVNKRALILFGILELIFLICVVIMTNIFKINNYTRSEVNVLHFSIAALVLTLSIFICYFFKIRISDYNWNLTLKSIIFVIILYVTFKIVTNIVGITNKTIHFENMANGKFVIGFIINTIVNSCYPGFYEEILYRGFLISGLKGLGLTDEKCNVIQAIIFGISHVVSPIISSGTVTWMFLLATAAQAMIGYMFGKLYFKTKSLSPCILLHGFFDVAMSL